MNASFGAKAALGFLAISLAAPALAQQSQGNFQLKAFVTNVRPDGGIEQVRTDAIGLPAGSYTRATNSVVPTIAAEYFLSPNLSLETICCVTPHDVRGSGALSGARLIENAVILPATVTAKLHLPLGGVKPYVGAGVTRFFIFGEDVGRDAAGLGATDVDLSNEWGTVLQAGVDAPLNERGLGLSVDVKRYFVDTTATFRAGNVTALRSDHKLDPWVISAGISLRF